MKSLEIIKIMEIELGNDQDKQVDWIEVIRRLEERGIKRDDIDEALDEADRQKIIRIEGGVCKWIDPNLREAEKVKTQKYFEMLSGIFKEGEIEFIPREELKYTLRKRGLNDKEIRRVFSEAARDYVLDSYSTSITPDGILVAGYSWIPLKERKRYAKMENKDRKWHEKWLEKKAMQEEMWEE